MFGRHWLFRVSIGANAFVLFYFLIYSSSTTYPTITTPVNVSPASSPIIRKFTKISEPEKLEELEDGSRVLSQFSQQPNEGPAYISQEPAAVAGPIPPPAERIITDVQANEVKIPKTEKLDQGKVPLKESESNKALETRDDPVPSSHETLHPDFDNNDDGVEEQVQNVVESESNLSKKTLQGFSERVKLFPCDDSTPTTHYGQRGPFWVLYNYIKPRKQFLCDEAITYTTHADFTFLDNLIPLLKRWNGPVSLTLYAPGTDFMDSLKRINYLRECTTDSGLVKDYVSFHLFFDYKHTPKVKMPMDPSSIPVNCSSFTSKDVTFGEQLKTYKKTKKLPYPVNVARNVAREMSTTQYILASDIELYPSPNLIPDFLDMIRRNESELQRPNPNKLFVLSIFEVEANVTALPYDKEELVHMLSNKSAIPFHKYVCSTCHRIPKANEWIKAPIQSGLRVFHVGKRLKPYHHWEPIYIGTKNDPMYDERLTWEGRSDKMTQGYVLCVLDYEFHILDNAFLIHRPGIKRTKTIPSKNPIVARQNSVISKIILPELKAIYGSRPGCYV